MNNPPPPSQEPVSPPPRWLMAALVLLRVGVTLAGTLVLFLGIFLGYFTVPILLIGAFVLLYALSDVGLLMAVRRTEAARSKRETTLTTEDHAGPPPTGPRP